jgi:hypothetical protein
MRPRECREFLGRLGEAIDGGADPHAAGCGWCAARLRAAREQARVLRALAAPPTPAALSTPAFLAAVHARANEAAEQRLRAVLGAGITPLPAPAADWDQPLATPELAAQLRNGLRSGPAPGWLWARIRTDVGNWRRGRRRVSRLRFAVAAAAVVIGGLLVFKNEGTYPAAKPVFVKISEPLDTALLGGGWTALGR